MDKYIEQLQPFFDKVSEKIGQGASFTWEVVYRQQYVYAVFGIFSVLISPLLKEKHRLEKRLAEIEGKI